MRKDAKEKFSPPGVDWVLDVGEDSPRLVNPSTGEVLEKQTKDLRAGLAAAEYKQKSASMLASAVAEALVGERIRLDFDEKREMVLLNEHGVKVAAAAGEGELFRFAALLLLEAATNYKAVGYRDGRIFGLGGAGYGAALRFSPAHQRRASSRSRRSARERIRLIQDRLACVCYDTKRAGRVIPVALVLTTPTVDPLRVCGVTEANEEARVYYAWELLRKLDIFKDHSFSAFRGYEITRKILVKGGYRIVFHPHFHVLMWSLFISHPELARAWWQCLRTATLEVYGHDLNSHYPDEESLQRAIGACAHIQAVRRRMKCTGRSRDSLGHFDGPVSLEDALQEVLKYDTKPSDIACYVAAPEHPGEFIVESLPRSLLQENIGRRSPRVFEAVGASRKRWTMPHWCRVKDGISPERSAEIIGEAARMAAQAVGMAVSSCSLDTPAISDGDQLGQPPMGGRQHRQTLRRLMATMDLHTWLQLAAKRAFRAVDFLEEGLRDKGYWVPAAVSERPG